MSDTLDISKLRQVKESREQKRVKIYNEILKGCHHKIVIYSQEEVDSCFFKVPEFKFGVPVYNLNSCIVYLIHKLRKNGFKVNYIYPNYLFISWKKSDEDKEREAKRLTSDMPQINDFVPINPQKIRNNNQDYYKNLSSNNNNNNNHNHNQVYDEETMSLFRTSTSRMNNR